jgi:hypothetical protein
MEVVAREGFDVVVRGRSGTVERIRLAEDEIPRALEETRQLARERGLDLAHSYGYGDSLNDVPLLETVGNPVAINPDMRLRRYAKRRGWDLRDFRGRKGNGRRSIVVRTTSGTVWALLSVLRILKRTIKGTLRGLVRRR